METCKDNFWFIKHSNILKLDLRDTFLYTSGIPKIYSARKTAKMLRQPRDASVMRAAGRCHARTSLLPEHAEISNSAIYIYI